MERIIYLTQENRRGLTNIFKKRGKVNTKPNKQKTKITQILKFEILKY